MSPTAQNTIHLTESAAACTGREAGRSRRACLSQGGWCPGGDIRGWADRTRRSAGGRDPPTAAKMRTRGTCTVGPADHSHSGGQRCSATLGPLRQTDHRHSHAGALITRSGSGVIANWLLRKKRPHQNPTNNDKTWFLSLFVSPTSKHKNRLATNIAGIQFCGWPTLSSPPHDPNSSRP